ncbi:MAG: C10 family peptidase [Bacteroidota bacterium]|nr:C10 family peptidase [Bacteroidota bacterium]
MKYLIFLLLCSITMQGFPKKVSKEKAKKVAENWGAMSMNLSKDDIEKELCFISKDDTSLFVFNFKNGGFVIVPTDDHTCPILAYSIENHIDLDNINPMLHDWLAYYSDMVKFNKKEPQDKKDKDKWQEIEEGISLKSVQASVPSLFETTNSSRWAYWRPYFNQAPQAQSQFYEGYNSCVPGGIARIMKYFKYPLIGTGIGSEYNNGSYFTQNINCFFNYDQMPFRLTYCGNGTNNCNDGSFNIIPGVTQAQIDEVGKIQYMAGLAVEMNWIGMGDTTTTTGTYGFTDEWATDMADHFYYTTPTSSDHWTSGEITYDPSGFKSGLRSSLNGGYPVLFRYDTSSGGGGHLIVIDGYENDNYFHFSMGFGGAQDAYYYLFSSDNDGVHLPRPHINLWGLDACLNIHPNCPPSQNLTVTNKTVSNGSGELIQSGNDLLMDHVTIQSGGHAVLRANHAIVISSDFEVALGGEILMVCKPCTN